MLKRFNKLSMKYEYKETENKFWNAHSLLLYDARIYDYSKCSHHFNYTTEDLILSYEFWVRISILHIKQSSPPLNEGQRIFIQAIIKEMISNRIF